MTTKKLTKKEFINILSSNKTALVFSKMNCHNDITEKIIETSQKENERLQKEGNFRDVENVTPSYIQFTGGSKLYFEKGTNYLSVNNIVIAVKEYQDSFDFATLWQYVVYLIKEN